MTQLRLYTFGMLLLLIGTALWVRAAPNERQILGKDGVDMVLIPAGEFKMGGEYGYTFNDSRSSAEPVHTVYVDAFYMDVHEVTNAQYKEFVDANPLWRKKPELWGDTYLPFWAGTTYQPGQDNYPVQGVHWVAAMAYAKWAGKRLPTEAEWEKAARGGLQGKKYPWGDTDDPTKANYNETVGGPTPVKSYDPNAYGLYDMIGNVSEWCLDEYDMDYYLYTSQRNPISMRSKRGKSITDAIVVGTHWAHFFKLTQNIVPDEELGEEIEAYLLEHHLDFETNYVVRGGNWSWSLSVSNRSYENMDDYFDDDNYMLYGFRCVKPIVP